MTEGWASAGERWIALYGSAWWNWVYLICRSFEWMMGSVVYMMKTVQHGKLSWEEIVVELNWCSVKN
jgi:hypothetical protein